MMRGLPRPPHLVDVKRIRELNELADGGRLTIGATVTHRSLERSPLVRARCPLVASVARHVANVRVRNVGTIGGNLAFADPHSDLATLFLALDAHVELVSPGGRRELSLGDFVRGPWETARRPDELLAGARLAPWPSPAAAHLEIGVHARPPLRHALGPRLDCEDSRANGRACGLEVAPPALLLDVLRDVLDLKGAKRSCDTQVCGACTILIDGMAVSACTYLAVEADGRAVLTVEGLAEGERLHPLQRAFLDAGAVQCGFCTSGMLLTARAMLAETPAPSREDVLHYLRGSLCRCTGYRKIVEAIMAVAETAR